MKPIDPNTFDPLTKPAEDTIHGIISSALSQIPLGDKLFEFVFAPPAEIRKTKWLHVLTDTLNELITAYQKTVIELRENEALLTAVIRCSDISFRNSDTEIWEALKGSIISVANAEKINESISTIYINTVAQLTGLHIQLIKFYAACKDKSPVALDYGLKVERLFIEDVAKFSEKFDESIPLHRIATDLHNLNIIDVPLGFPKALGSSNFINMRLTEFGQAFLSHIDPRKN